MKRIVLSLSIVAFMLVFALSVHAQLDTHGNLRLGNQYIEIVVNGNKENMGRFAIDITGGNPISPSDDGEPLIYGRPQPWTSFTTVQIDGVNYIFGGKTNQRAGKNGKYGEVTVPPTIVSENGQAFISTKTVFNKQVEVEQILTFSKSSTTGLFDTVLIKYRVTNLDTAPHKVGIRVIMDTMLGSNDGAPFRVGAQAITTDTYFLQGGLPEFWQAFDALSDTKVTAQGTLKGPEVTIPDKIYYADWGSMADGLWEFKFSAGEEFWREGEFELDSAIALYWDADSVSAGESRNYSTKYGLGGITVVPGILSLGVTSPAEVVFDTQTSSFPVVAYIENTSEIVAKDVKARIELPAGFEVVGGTAEVLLGNLDPASTGQVAWGVKPTNGAKVPEKMIYKVKVEASNTDSNAVEREVSFTPPPKVTATFNHPKELTIKNEKFYPNPFEVSVKVKNAGGSPAHEIQSQIILPPGLNVAEKERMMKSIRVLNPGEEVTIPWMVEVSSMVLPGQLPFGVEVVPNNSPKIALVGNVSVPALSSKVYMIPLRSPIKVGEFFGVQIRAANVKDMETVLVNLAYDTKKARAMYVSRGTLFVANGQRLPWTDPFIDRDYGLITGIKGELPGVNDESGVIAEVYFKALEPGALSIGFADIEITNSLGNVVHVKAENLTIEIQK